MTCLQRSVIFATALLLRGLPLDFDPLARAADPPASPHEAAVLDRIFVNWKARHDRVHSLHFTWDCRTTYRKGAIDPSSGKPPFGRFKRDQVFEQFGEQLFFDGEDRICLVSTPKFKVPQAKLIDTKRVVARWAILPKATLTISYGSIFETGGAPAQPVSRGVLSPSQPADWRARDPTLQALLLTFRQQTTMAYWLKGQCRLVDENATMDNSRYVKFQRVIAGKEEACWVSPARDDVVVHWTIHNPPLSDWEGSINYKKDRSHGWIPSEWTSEIQGYALREYKVTNYAINEKIDPAIFSQDLPAGAVIQDSLNATSRETVRFYVVEQDGSKRMISSEESARLWWGTDPSKKPVLAKPQANKEPRTK